MKILPKHQTRRNPIGPSISPVLSLFLWILLFLLSIVCILSEQLKYATDNVDLGKDFSSMKILSYNVWFRQDLELHKRMKAIGDLVQLHSPHFIYFQEVTPNIYDIFKQSPWWNGYHCSVSSETAYSKPYFCMLLSKLPVKSFQSKSFSNSIMGRELCIAEVEAASGSSLVVATSHLESPCPAPPKWDHMYSKERVEQANEALNLLKKHPNIVHAYTPGIIILMVKFQFEPKMINLRAGLRSSPSVQMLTSYIAGYCQAKKILKMVKHGHNSKSILVIAVDKPTKL